MFLLLISLARAAPDSSDAARPALDAPNRHVADSWLGSTVHLGYRIWRVAISPGDGPRCPMRPTCSSYAQQAFARDGLGGYVLTFDRLLRDGNVADYPFAPDGHALDPLANHPAVGELLGGYCRSQRDDGAELCL
ncbi:MAG: membrane protein insertion efficiency factor YidD [Proteobacteria bacterium]|nr:membrane protein insertion efficiency factor YidD [Pseudomonadota bacterium]MCP4918893.1 membrane protein insertion efficiency factor YidD [Pseudomonadota bacterium]